MVLYFARDTDVMFCGSSSLKKAVVDVFVLHVDVVPMLCYTLTLWLWLPANVSKLFVSNRKQSYCWSLTSKPFSSRVFRTSGDEDSSSCNFHIITESLRNKNELHDVFFVFLRCMGP